MPLRLSLALAASLALLAACGGRAPIGETPRLLTTAELAALGARAGAGAGNDPADSLAARAAGLRSEAAAMRRPVLDPAQRDQLQDAIPTVE